MTTPDRPDDPPETADQRALPEPTKGGSEATKGGPEPTKGDPQPAPGPQPASGPEPARGPVRQTPQVPQGPDERLAKAQQDAQEAQTAAAAASARAQELQTVITELQAEIQERDQLVQGYAYDKVSKDLLDTKDVADKKRRFADGVDAKVRAGVDALIAASEEELNALKEQTEKDAATARRARESHDRAVTTLADAQQRVTDIKRNVDEQVAKLGRAKAYEEKIEAAEDAKQYARMYFLVKRQLALLEISLPTADELRDDLNEALSAVGAAKEDEAARKAERTAAEDAEKLSNQKLTQWLEEQEQELLRQIDERWPASTQANAA
jgi:hypothetical protein